MIDHVLGLDPGKRRDPAAFSVLKAQSEIADMSTVPELRREREHVALITTLHLVHLEQHRGWAYPKLVERVQTVMNTPQLQHRCVLVMDVTGVGEAVADMFVQVGIPPIMVNSVASGRSVTMGDEGSRYNVPKRDLVISTQVAYDAERLIYPARKKLPSKASPALQSNPNRFSREILEEYLGQMKDFERSINTAGFESYEAAQESIHDDLVLAVALPVWYATRVLRVTQVRLEDAKGDKPKLRGEYDPLRAVRR